MIELLDHTGSDMTVTNSARVSFADFGNWNECPEGYSEERAEKLIGYLAKHKHLTPFRHVYVTIRCKEPIFTVRQLGKHQVGLSWNEVSRRYVKGDIEFYIPDEWRAAPEGSIKQGSAGVHPDSKTWRHVYGGFIKDAEAMYKSMIMEGIAPEQARMVLPQSMMTSWVWSGSLLAFAHVYNERSTSGAQQEVRQFAKELDEIIEPLFPIAWNALTNK